jgi:alkylation response protein AidB-like acyl-CoA dehydrogenase
MDFSLTEEQKILSRSVEKFAKAEIAPGVEEREEKGEFSREIWQKLSEFGMTGLSIPKEYGGGGADALTSLIAAQSLARGGNDGGLNNVWGSHLFLCAMPIAEMGTEKQKKKYLPKMATGEWIGGLGLTEPDAGSDATSLKTRAEKRGDYYILNGSKTFISNAPIADLLLVVVSTDSSKRSKGLSLFIIETSLPGFSTGKPLKKHMMHSAPTSEVFLDDCQVPTENLIGEEGQGFIAMLKSLGWERIGLASLLGLMEADWNLCLEYVKQRKQFGKPIGSFQQIQAKLAEMKMDLEAARWLTYHLAWKKDRGENIGLDAAITKTFLTEAGLRNSLKAVQIFGGYGAMREYSVGRNLWLWKTATIGGGTSEIQRNIMGRMLTGL